MTRPATRAWLVVVLPLLALLGCDDMSVQSKDLPYRTARTGPGPVPPGIVEYGTRPTAPPPLTLALIERGQDRFRQFCTPCHSELGNGGGPVVQRGFSPPPSYHIARLRDAPTRHFYDVLTEGYGAMYSFAERIPPDDRWAIASYIRALQRSTAGTPDDLTPQQRTALR